MSCTLLSTSFPGQLSASFVVERNPPSCGVTVSFGYRRIQMRSVESGKLGQVKSFIVLLKIHLSSFEALSQWSTAFLAWYKHNTSLKITITDCLIDAPKILVWTCAWCLSITLLSAPYFKQEQDGKRLLTFEKFYSKHIIIWINAHMVHIRADQT